MISVPIKYQTPTLSLVKLCFKKWLLILIYTLVYAPIHFV